MRFQRVEFRQNVGMQGDKGGGVGSFFTNIFKSLVPLVVANIVRKGSDLVKNTGIVEEAKKATKRTALEAGLDIVTDVLDGKKLQSAAKKRIVQAGKKLAGCEKGGGKDESTTDTVESARTSADISKDTQLEMGKGQRRGKSKGVKKGGFRGGGRRGIKKRGKRGGKKSKSSKKTKLEGQQLVRQWL